MKQRPEYTVIIPRVDYTGPTNVAIDIASAAALAGWKVTILYLSGKPVRNDLGAFALVRKFRFFDLFRLKGIIHSHGFRPDLYASLLSWNHHSTIASTIHGHFPGHLRFDYQKYKVAFAWWIWSLALKRMDHRICISKTMARFYRPAFKNLSLEVAYNFRTETLAEETLLDPRVSRWICAQRSNNRVILLYAGSLISRKNVRSVVESVLTSQNLSLLLCGHGPERQDLESIPDPESRLFFAGHVKNLRDFFNICDLLVLPSHAEGLPLVILEAASSGLPSLMSNIAVHRELASLGFGVTFNRFSLHDFCEKAQMLALDRTVERDAQRVRLWRENFSDGPGFARYKQLLTKSIQD